MIRTGALFIFSYLVGAVPTGYLLTKIMHKKDIREYGSGNIGFANVLRTVGVVTGILVLVVDTGKAFLATYYFSRLFEEATPYQLLFGIAVILGNIFNPFLKFRGGKGVSAGLGVALAINPFSVIFSLLAFLITVRITKYISLGSLIAATVYLISNMIFYVFIEYDIYSAVFGILIFCAILLRHISNIKRLIQGEEDKIGTKKK